jgi:hypothetical protein
MPERETFCTPKSAKPSRLAVDAQQTVFLGHTPRSTQPPGLLGALT